MANNYGYMAKIGLADDGLEKSLAEINNSLKEVDRSISATDKAIANAGKQGLDTTQLWEQQYDLLNTQIETTTEKLSALESVQSKVAEAYENGAINYTSYIEFQNEAANTAAELEKLKTRAEQAHTAMSVPVDDRSTYQVIQTALDEVNGKYAKAVNELNEVDRAMKQSGESEELLAQKSQLLGDAVHAAQIELMVLINQQEKMNNAVKIGDISAEEYRAFQRELAIAKGNVDKYREAIRQNTQTLMENGTAAKDTSEQTSELERSVNNAGNAMENTGEKALTLSDIIKGNLVSESVSKLLDGLKRAAEKTIDFSKEGVDLASNLTEVQNVVDATFGSDNNKIYEFADTAAEKFGLAKLSAEQFAGTMGTMLKSSGITEELDEMSIALTGLAGDMASFYNIDVDTAFEKLRSGIAGESEPLRQLGINMNVTMLEAYALSEGIDKSWDSMSQAEQTMLRYNYIMSQTADAQGDFSRTSDSLANQQRILELNIQNVKAAMGEELLPVAQGFLTDLNDNMPKIQDAAEKLGNVIADNIDDIGELAADKIPDLIDDLSWIVDNGDNIISIAEGFLILWTGSKITSAVEDTSKLLSNFKGLGTESGGTAGGISTVGTAISSVGTAITVTAAAATAFVNSDAFDKIMEFFGAYIHEENEAAKAAYNYTDSIKEQTENLNKLSDPSSEMYNPREAFNQAIQSSEKYVKKQEENADRIKKLEEEIANGFYYIDPENEAGWIEYTSDEIRAMQEEAAALENQNANIDALLKVRKDIVKNYDSQIISHEEQAIEGKKAVQANAGKTNKEALDTAWEKIRADTKKEMEELDHLYKTNQITEEEYWARRKKYLEAHRDEESEEWWGYYEDVKEYYEGLSEAERKAAEKAAQESEEAAEAAFKEKWDAVKREQKENGYDDIWLEDQYKALLDSLEKGTELYYKYYDIYLDLHNKNIEAEKKAAQEEIGALKAWAEEAAETVKKKFEDIQNEIESVRKEYINALDLYEEVEKISEEESGIQAKQKALGLAVAIDPNASDKKHEDEKGIVIKDVSPQTEELRKYNKNMEALENTGISEEYLEEIKSMGFDKRKQYVEALLKMPESERKEHYAEIEEYYAEAGKAAENEVKKGLKDTGEAVTEGTEDIFKGMAGTAYENGKSTALAYLQGLAETIRENNNILNSFNLSSFKAKNTDNYPTGASPANAAQSPSKPQGNFYSGGTVISVSVAGKELIRKTFDELVNLNRLTRGNNLNV